MEEAFRTHAIVRILRKTDNDFCGMGFLIGNRFVLTCLHVVLDSLSLPRSCEVSDLPSDEIIIDFPGLLPIKQTSSAKIINARGCFKDCNERDIALLEIVDKRKLNVPSTPLLAIGTNVSLPGISCSYFISRNGTDYGWGDGVISNTLGSGRVQINQMLSGAGKLVEHGFSGTPVWVNHMDGVVGMLDQVIPKQGVATFIPNYILMEFLPPEIQFEVLPAYINRVKAPKLPHDYIKRTQLTKEINRYLYVAENDEPGNLVVILGPSGSGKTHAVLDVFYSYPHVKHWIDCQGIYERSEMFAKLLNVASTDLIVVDNLTIDHPLYKEKWLKDLKCNILVLTSEDAIAENVCAQHYKNVDCNKIVRTTGFDLPETERYFRIAISEILLSSADIEKFHRITSGVPILIQFLKAIILDEKSTIEAENRVSLFAKEQSFKKYLLKNDFSQSEVNQLLVNKWLEKLKTTSKTVIGILSFVPIVGMSSAALLHTSKISADELEKAITALCDSGFIQIQFKGISKKENLIIIHDLVKRLVVENKTMNNPDFISNYISYLEVNYDNKIIGDSDLITKVDIMMLQMKRLFQHRSEKKLSSDAFFNEMYKINRLLDKYIPFGSGSSVTSEWIGKFLENVIPTAECSLLISLGQAVHNFESNALMARVIWQGAYNYDSWARACCIHAAVAHWKRLGGDFLNEAKRHLDEWIKIYLNDRKYFTHNKGANKYYDNQIDLDIGTALGGLCHLGFEDEAIAYLECSEFNRRHPCTVTSDLVIILYLASHNDFENKRREKAQKLIEKNFQRVSNSSAKFLADQLLEEKKYKLPPLSGGENILTAKPFGATISCAAYSNEFRQFTYDNGDAASMIGGIVPANLRHN